MNLLPAIASLVRAENILFIIGTQVLFYYYFLLPALIRDGFEPNLSSVDNVVFLLITPFIAAGGNIINDLLDQSGDLSNLKRRAWTLRFSRKTARHAYLVCNGVAVLCSMYLTIQYDRWYAFLLVPAGIGILFLYSYRLKYWPWVGNATISLLCGGVVWVLFLPDLDAWSLTISFAEPARNAWIAGMFGLFAATANFFREWIKDLEDRRGDAKHGAKTLAIVLPVQSSMRLIQVLAGLGLILIIWGLISPPFVLEPAERWITGLLLIPPLIYLIFRVKKYMREDRWDRLSRGFKIYMLLGLILACILKWL